MFCAQCGQRIADGAKFCSHCGAAAPTPVAASPTPVAPAPPDGIVLLIRSKLAACYCDASANPALRGAQTNNPLQREFQIGCGIPFRALAGHGAKRFPVSRLRTRRVQVGTNRFAGPESARVLSQELPPGERRPFIVSIQSTPGRFPVFVGKQFFTIPTQEG